MRIFHRRDFISSKEGLAGIESHLFKSEGSGNYSGQIEITNGGSMVYFDLDGYSEESRADSIQRIDRLVEHLADFRNRLHEALSEKTEAQEPPPKKLRQNLLTHLGDLPRILGRSPFVV